MNADALTERRGALWLEDLRNKPLWTFTEAVTWVAYRDFDILRAWLFDARGPVKPATVAGHYTNTMAVVKHAADDPKAAEPLPLDVLASALRAGKVSALASPGQRGGYRVIGTPKAAPLPTSAWYSHRIGPWLVRSFAGREPGRIGEEPFLLPADWKWTSSDADPYPYWARVEVDAKSLLAQFPAVQHIDAEPPWWPKPGQRQKDWLGSPEAWAEALSRVQRDGDDPHNRAAIIRHLLVMWRDEAKRTTGTAGSFEQTLIEQGR
jgi:hypothetical protein